MYRPRLIQAKIALGRIQLVLDPHEGAGLKPGDHLYPYVTDSGALGSTAALLDRAPDDPTSYDSFFADNQGTFEIDRETDHEVAREAAQRLRGTRLQPCYVDVTRVKRLDDQLLVEGMPHGLYDPRLPYLDASEGTSFGAGSFNVADVRALWDGGYCYIGLSPMADLIAATVGLGFTTQPSSVFARVGMSPAVQVAAVDGQGNIATDVTVNVTLAITSGTGGSGAVLGRTTTVAAVNGVAAFSNLMIH